MKNVLIFLGGAGIGAAVTWKLVEKYYKDLADEEIASVVETFKAREAEINSVKNDSLKEEKVELESSVEKKEKLHYDNTIDAMRYASENIKDLEENLINPKDTTKKPQDIEVIPPEEFGNEEGFDSRSWTYYEDEVLVDEYDTVVENPESIIGDALKHFGEYEDDSVYVRNAIEKCDYEILKSEKEFNS